MATSAPAEGAPQQAVVVVPADVAQATTTAPGAAEASAAPAEAQQAAAETAAEPTTEAPAAPQATAAAPPPVVDKKKQTFLSAFFGGGNPQKSAAQEAVRPLVQPQKPAAETQVTETASAEAAPAKPLIQLASAKSEEDRQSGVELGFGGGDALPGVRQTMLFEIKRKSGLDDDSDIDLNEAEGVGAVQLASAAGLARLAPNGLLKQRDSVDTACLKPSLVRMLKSAEARFGKRAIITSGYRSPAHNKKVRGAERSQHMFCAAADLVMPGVSKLELAKYFRSLPGRGGVGTYCHTEAIHVDVGPERDWNWRCRRRG
ncbi:MAG TPA: YcbK family protein [Mesorhizobium sp.]|nr:YcbK family protein [Mesorhizobium sp.]